MGISRRGFLKITGLGAVVTAFSRVKSASAKNLPTSKNYATFEDFAIDRYADGKADVTRTGMSGLSYFEREELDGITERENFALKRLKPDVTIDTVISDASSFFSKDGFECVLKDPEKGRLVMVRESGNVRERYEATIGIYEGIKPENRRLEFALAQITTTYI